MCEGRLSTRPCNVEVGVAVDLSEKITFRLGVPFGVGLNALGIKAIGQR
jgi:hypothetical protein